jgi:hypothetical protein
MCMPICDRIVRAMRTVASVKPPPLKLASTNHRMTIAIIAAKMPFITGNVWELALISTWFPPTAKIKLVTDGRTKPVYQNHGTSRDSPEAANGCCLTLLRPMFGPRTYT